MSLRVIFLFVAVILFGLAALGMAGKINPLPSGLAFFAASFLV